MLDEYAEEPLEAAEQCSMHHDRPLGAAVASDEFELEALRKVEVELNRAELPLAAMGVAHLQVDLRSVERSATRVLATREADGLAGAPEHARRPFPIFNRADRLAFGPRRDERRDIAEAERVEHV